MSERGSQGRRETPEVVYSWFQDELEKVNNVLVEVSEQIVKMEEDAMYTEHHLNAVRERYFELLRRRDYIKSLEHTTFRSQELDEIRKSLEDIHYLMRECRVDTKHAKEKLHTLYDAETRLRKMEADLINQEDAADDKIASLPVDAIRN